MLVVGQKEEEDRTVSVRSRFAGDEGVKPLTEFIDQICEEIRTKAIRKEEKKDK
jgi:threonyl-tRNA synthetase